MSLPMLLARRLNASSVVRQSRFVSSTAPVKAGYWNKDWRPADEPPEVSLELSSCSMRIDMHSI